MTNGEIKSELIRLAAECFRGSRLPPQYSADWNLPKRTSAGVRNAIEEQMEQARATAHGWGKRLKELADSLPKTVCENRNVYGCEPGDHGGGCPHSK